MRHEYGYGRSTGGYTIYLDQFDDGDDMIALDRAATPRIQEIRAAIVARMQELKPLVDECARLERAEAALAKADAKLKLKR